MSHVERSDQAHQIFGTGAIVALIPGRYTIGKKTVSAAVFLEYFTKRVGVTRASKIFVWHNGKSAAASQPPSTSVTVWVFPGSRPPKHGPSGCSKFCILVSLGILRELKIVDDKKFALWHNAVQSQDAAAASRVTARDVATAARARRSRSRSGSRSRLSYKSGSRHLLYVRGATTSAPGIAKLENTPIAVYGRVANAEGKNVSAVLREAMEVSGYNMVSPLKARRVVVPDDFDPSVRAKGLPARLRAPGHFIKYSTFIKNYGLTQSALEATGAAGDYGISSDMSAAFRSESHSAAAAAGAGVASALEGMGLGGVRSSGHRAPKAAAAAAPKKKRLTAYNMYISTRTKQEKNKLGAGGKYDVPTMSKRFGAEWQGLTTEAAKEFFAAHKVEGVPANFQTPLSRGKK